MAGLKDGQQRLQGLSLKLRPCWGLRGYVLSTRLCTCCCVLAREELIDGQLLLHRGQSTCKLQLPSSTMSTESRAAPAGLSFPPSSSKPPRKDYHEKVDGRSPVVRLKGETAKGFFEVQDALTASEGKQISGSSTIQWLLSSCREGIASLLKSVCSPVKAAKQVPPKQLPEECNVPGFTELLVGVSPSRILPALRKREGTIFDEELGFLDFENDPDILECLAEEIGPEVEEPRSTVKPKF